MLRDAIRHLLYVFLCELLHANTLSIEALSVFLNEETALLQVFRCTAAGCLLCGSVADACNGRLNDTLYLFVVRVDSVDGDDTIFRNGHRTADEEPGVYQCALTIEKACKGFLGNTARFVNSMTHGNCLRQV